MGGFDVSQLARIDATLEVEIETWAAPGAPTHRVITWIVTADGEVYVRSVNGSRSRWYRELTATREGILHLMGEPIPVRAWPAVDPPNIDRCSRGLRRKYVRDSALSTMLRPETLPTTLKLEPR